LQVFYFFLAICPIVPLVEQICCLVVAIADVAHHVRSSSTA
jgi:hypothetical protein